MWMVDDMNLKQLFCSHIFKEESQEVLYKSRELSGLITYSNYVYKAAHLHCLKCGKKKIKKLRGIEV